MAACDDPLVLLQRMKQGQADAFNMLYERYFPLVYRIALRVTGERHEAEDVCHDVFLDVYRRPDVYDPARGSFEAWLAVKTRNRAIDILRKGRRVIIEDVTAEKHAASSRREQTMAALDHVLSLEQKQAIHSALHNIPDMQRMVIYHHYFEGFTHHKLSEYLRKPLGTVKSLVRYGLKNMRKQLMQWEETETSRGGDSA